MNTCSWNYYEKIRWSLLKAINWHIRDVPGWKCLVIGLNVSHALWVRTRDMKVPHSFLLLSFLSKTFSLDTQPLQIKYLLCWLRGGKIFNIMTDLPLKQKICAIPHTFNKRWSCNLISVIQCKWYGKLPLSIFLN